MNWVEKKNKLREAVKKMKDLSAQIEGDPTCLAQSIFKMARQFHTEIFGRLLTIKEKLPTGAVSTPEMADIAYFFRQAAQLADDLRKEITAAEELAEKLACLRWVTECEDMSGKPDPIRGEVCIATPDVKQMSTLPRPHSDPQAYAELLDFLDIHGAGTGLVRLHWPSLVELVTKRAEEGKPLPPGCDPDKTYPVYKLRLRKKTGIEPDEV